MRLATFILAVLLLGGAVDPTRGWLIALVVVSGLAAIRPRLQPWLALRPAIDLRLATFILAVLLLAGAIDATRGPLIALTAVAGVAMLAPKLVGVNDWSGTWPYVPRWYVAWPRWRRSEWDFSSDWDTWP